MNQQKLVALRANGHRVELYNEGLSIFCYDNSKEQEINDSGFIEHYIDSAAGVDGQLKAMADDGSMVIVGLEQDDPVVIDVVIGKPLSPKEKKLGKWHKVQKAFLSLSSGKLRMDSFNTLAMYPDNTGHPGALIDVPPGDYLFSLQRLDLDSLELSESEENLSPTRRQLPQMFVCLTPAADAKVPRKRQAALAFEDAVGKGRMWLRDWSVGGKVFSGQANWMGTSEVRTNLAKKSVHELGLRWGDRIRVATDKWSFDAVYLSKIPARYFAAGLASPLQQNWLGDKPTHYASIECIDEVGTEVVCCQRLEGRSVLDQPDTEGRACQIELLDNPFLPRLSASQLGKSSMVGAELHGELIQTCANYVVANFGSKEIAKVAGAGDANLEVTIGDNSHKLLFGTGVSLPEIQAAQKELYLKDPLAAAECKKIEEIEARLAKTEDFLSMEGMKLYQDLQSELATIRKGLSRFELGADAMAKMPLVADVVGHWEFHAHEMCVLAPLCPSPQLFFEGTAGTPVTIRATD